MRGFSEPLWLVVAGAWALAMVLLARRQKPALEWISGHVAERFHSLLTRYDVPSAGLRGVRRHFTFLFLLGTILLTAAAGPFTVGSGEKEIESRTVLLVLDASLSMGATDTEPHPGTGEPPASRFAQATRLASELVEAMPAAAFGLISFSGVTVVHAPPTRDHSALATILDTATYHVDLTLSGTRYSSAFDAVIHLFYSPAAGGTAQGRDAGYQVVLISDGELPRTDDYADALDVLAELGVPVHTVGVGTTEGQERVIYKPEDVINSVEEKRVAREYHTRRVDSTLAAVAEATGGSMMIVADGGWVGDLVPALERAKPAVVEIEGKDKKDLSAYPLAAFLFGFLIETLIVARRPRRNHPRGGPGDRGRPEAGRGRPRPYVATLLVVALLLTGCRGPVRVFHAHYHNELGVGLLHAGQYSPAAARFEKSLSYKVREHVPLYNLANNAAAREEFAVAHDYYQEAMLVEPRLIEAHYNDGHALYRWGELEIDLEECVFDRARQLWTQAAKRFRDAADLAGEGDDLADRALEDAGAVDTKLAELTELADNCTPPPPPPPSPPPEDGEPPPPSGEPPPPPPPPEDPTPEGGDEPPPPSGDSPPPPGGGEGGGLSDDEREEIQAALERIRQEAAGASGYRQSRHQQITEDTVGKAAGMELWW